MVKVEENRDVCRLVFSGELTIYHAAVLKEMLVSALAEVEQPVEMDLSAVTEFDTAGLQLLLAVCKQRQARVAEASPVAQELINLYGLTAIFSQAREIAA